MYVVFNPSFIETNLKSGKYDLNLAFVTVFLRHPSLFVESQIISSGSKSIVVAIASTISRIVYSSSPQQTNGMSKTDTQRMDIFVTGIVGRSLGSGTFTAEDIPKLTAIAVRAFNENLKKL